MNALAGLTSHWSLFLFLFMWCDVRVELRVWRPGLFIDVLLKIRYRFVLRFNEQMTWKNIRKSVQSGVQLWEYNLAPTGSAVLMTISYQVRIPVTIAPNKMWRMGGRENGTGKIRNNHCHYRQVSEMSHLTSSVVHVMCDTETLRHSVCVGQQ